MIETPLNKVLNTMRQYVENIYEHDSEPMLNWKDIKLVLDEIERLNKMIDLKSFFIQDLLELISYSNDNDLHTKVHLTGIEYQEKLKELKEGK